jgi:hypothetical protein
MPQPVKLRISLIKNGREIASKISEVEKPSDIAAAVQNVFEQVRSVHSGSFWDCEIQLRQA